MLTWLAEQDDEFEDKSLYLRDDGSIEMKHHTHIVQILWLNKCEWLRNLRLRNLCARTILDEEFLYSLPQNIPKMQWNWDGQVYLCRETCRRLGYPLSPPRPFHTAPYPKNPEGRGEVMCSRLEHLNHGIVRAWADDMIRAAGSSPELSLNFKGVEAYLEERWMELRS